jgi:hypothetical protein
MHFFVESSKVCLHLSSSRETQDSGLQGFADEILKSAKKVNQDKKPEDPKGSFSEARKEVNYILG